MVLTGQLNMDTKPRISSASLDCGVLVLCCELMRRRQIILS
jgi:hypothetical protein